MPRRLHRLVSASIALSAVLGVILVVAGAWVAWRIGPDGVVKFHAGLPASGTILVGPRHVSTVDAPLSITVRRGDGGPVWLGSAAAADAATLLGSGARTVVSGVSLLDGSLTLRSAGSGAPHPVARSDIWTTVVSGNRTAHLVVPPRAPAQAVVAASGDGAPLRDVTVELRWQRRTWFVQALVVLMTGGVLIAAALRLRARRAQR